MNLGKWWLRHGPGSPGSVARAMLNSYNKMKRQNPEASQDELLLYTLHTRYRWLGQDEACEMIQRSSGRLVDLTVQVVHRENPSAEGARVNAPEMYALMREVIEEVIEHSD